MSSIRIEIEQPGGKRAIFEREADERFNSAALRSMWQDLMGEVSNWMRHGEPTEAKSGD